MLLYSQHRPPSASITMVTTGQANKNLSIASPLPPHKLPSSILMTPKTAINQLNPPPKYQPRVADSSHRLQSTNPTTSSTLIACVLVVCNIADEEAI